VVATDFNASDQPAAMPIRLSYVLVTPARNEEAFIEATLRAVIKQNVIPAKWVIVSDGSTDQTDAIVERYCSEHLWIELIRLPSRRERHFAAKANAFNVGYARVRDLSFDLIANLDSDITFGPEYFEYILRKFEVEPSLGAAGTPFVENFARPREHSYGHRYASLEHVSGACQVFRRECFEEVGGYVPIEEGAVDWIAVTTARMNGWKTRTFPEKVCFHHRRLGTGTGTHNPLRTRFHYGKKAYYVGGHPLWEVLRGFFQMRHKPLLIGGALFIGGYLWAGFKREKRPVSAELALFHKSEQLARLRKSLRLSSL
jgi:glycosyltransferase involved in cell wall biosynthesis